VDNLGVQVKDFALDPSRDVRRNTLPVYGLGASSVSSAAVNASEVSLLLLG
jgi:hypothetical protein